MMQLKDYQHAFFKDNWLQRAKENHQTDIKKVLERADLLLTDHIIFDDALDMEACHTPYRISEYYWNDYPEEDSEWTYMLSRNGFMVDLAMAYVYTEDSRYLKKWAELIQHFIQTNGEPHASNGPSWRPIDSGIRLMNWLKSLTYLPLDELSEDLRLLLDQGMKDHIAYLHASYIDKYRLSNWGVLAISGIAVYDLFFPEHLDEAMVAWVWEQLGQQLDLQFYPDGVHWEQSPLYHHEVIASYAYILQVSEALSSELPINLREKLQQPMYAAYYMADSSDYLSPLNDSDYVDLTSIYDWYRAMGFLADKKETPTSLYSGMIYQKTPSRQTLPALFKGEKSGFSALKTVNTYLTLFNGLHGSSHGHASTGSFTLNVNQQEMIADGGRYTYVEGTTRKMLKEPAAHNSFFDEDDLSTIITESWAYDHLPWPIHQQAEEISNLKGGYLFSNSWLSQKKGAEQLSSYARDIILLEEEGLILLYDSYRGSGKTITATYNFHEACQLNQSDQQTISFNAANIKGQVYVHKGNVSLERQQRSSVYNQLASHDRLISQLPVEQCQAHQLTVISFKGDVSCEPLTFYQNKHEQAYEDGAGLRVQLINGNILDFYVLFNDIIKGDKLFKTENEQFFYGKINIFDDNNHLFKIK